jgi:hypothetical protein
MCTWVAIRNIPDINESQKTPQLQDMTWDTEDHMKRATVINFLKFYFHNSKY